MIKLALFTKEEGSGFLPSLPSLGYLLENTGIRIQHLTLDFTRQGHEPSDLGTVNTTSKMNLEVPQKVCVRQSPTRGVSSCLQWR